MNRLGGKSNTGEGVKMLTVLHQINGDSEDLPLSKLRSGHFGGLPVSTW